MFTFRLQPVLRYRTFLEEMKQLAFAEKQRAYFRETQRGETLKEIRYRYFESLREETTREDLSVNIIAFYQSYLFHLDREIGRQMERIAEARRNMETAQGELIEARKDREVMDRAKDRALELHREEEDYKHRRFLDELATVRHVRARSGLDPFDAAATSIA